MHHASYPLLQQQAQWGDCGVWRLSEEMVGGVCRGFLSIA